MSINKELPISAVELDDEQLPLASAGGSDMIKQTMTVSDFIEFATNNFDKIIDVVVEAKRNVNANVDYVSIKSNSVQVTETSLAVIVSAYKYYFKKATSIPATQYDPIILHFSCNTMETSMYKTIIMRIYDNAVYLSEMALDNFNAEVKYAKSMYTAPLTDDDVTITVTYFE